MPKTSMMPSLILCGHLSGTRFASLGLSHGFVPEKAKNLFPQQASNKISVPGTNKRKIVAIKKIKWGYLKKINNGRLTAAVARNVHHNYALQRLRKFFFLSIDLRQLLVAPPLSSCVTASLCPLPMCPSYLNPLDGSLLPVPPCPSLSPPPSITLPTPPSSPSPYIPKAYKCL
jgi:hypothetical protein